jgi:hypothetical protein
MVIGIGARWLNTPTMAFEIFVISRHLLWHRF